MMHSKSRFLVCAAALVLAGCSENPLSAPKAVTSAIEPPTRVLTSLVAPPPVCSSVASSQATVDSLLPQLFSPGQGRRGKAQGFSNNIVQARRNGNTALERTYVDSLVNYTLQNYYAGNLIGGQGTDTQTRVLNFFYALYCASSISPIPDLSGIFNAQNTVLIRNTTPTTEVNTPLKDAAVNIQQGDVPDSLNGQPFFGTFVSVYRTTNPLPTSLDWYGIDGYKQGAFEFVTNPPVTFDSPVLAGVCITFDDQIVTSPSDLRIAHQVQPGYVPVVPGNYVVTTSGGTIEIGAPLSTGPLNLHCDPLQLADRGVVGRGLQYLANLVLPGKLFAELLGGGGIGGQMETFSPFGAVDTKLVTTGTGPSSPQYIQVGNTQVTAPVTVTVKTRNGASPVDAIPVSFAPGASFAPATAATGSNGTASSTWTLVAGLNTATGTPVQPPLVFQPVNFSVTAIQLLPVSIGTTSLPNGQQGVAYGPVTLTASGGTGSYTWALAPGSNLLPSGVSLSAGGVLGGTPTVFGSFTFTVRVTSGPSFADKALTVSILPPPVVITTASPLPAATVGVPYSQSILATGGDGSYSWAQTAGSLPAGTGFSSAGVLSGTPTSSGTSNFTVRVSSAGGTLTQSKAFDLTVVYPSSFGSLAFQPGPSGSQCYALNAVMAPNVAVKVTNTSGGPVAGVQVDLVAVINNGSKVATSQPFAITGADGMAVFNTLSINKTGGYRFIASTAAPWPVASVQSGRFNISPSC